MVKKTLLYKKLELKKSSLKENKFFVDQNSVNLIINEVEEKNTEEKLGEAHNEIVKQKSKKKTITNALMFGLNIIIVVAILVSQILSSEITPLSWNWLKLQYVPIILIAFALVMFLETFRVTLLLKQSTKKSRPAICYKMIAIGRYWDCITPMSTGGQPFQIFYLNKRGVDAGTAISIPLARYVIFQLAWTAVSIFATIYSAKNFTEANLVSVASYVGFIINLVMIVGVLILSWSKKIGKLLVVKGIRLLQKMKIVKNYEKVYDKVMTTVNGFQTTMASYTKKMGTFLLMLLLQLLQFIINFSIPFLIYLLLGGNDLSMYLPITVYTLLIELASGFIPTPGGTGMSEVAFTIAFASLYPNGTVFWGLLLWRFMNYYIYIVQGFVVLMYDYIRGNKKYEWQKKKWALEAESNKFKQDQLKKFNKKKRTGKIKI